MSSIYHKSSGKLFLPLVLALLAMTGLFLSSCLPNYTPHREAVARGLALPVQMIKRDIETDTFQLRAYERAYDRGGDVTIYIEGEGDGWAAHRTPAQNPTPRNPVAMYMAARDGGQNVVYLARPCQYVPLPLAGPCETPKYWVEGRYAPEVVESINQAIDDIKDEYNFQNVDLVGYAGGGALAIMVAADRHDVLSIRTVATILDHEQWTKTYDQVPLTGSLNAVDFAAEVSRIPQHHFLPEWSRWDYKQQFRDYYTASGKSGCLRASTINDTDDDKGWGKPWPELKKQPLDCLNL